MLYVYASIHLDEIPHLKNKIKIFIVTPFPGLYRKHIMIIIMTIVSDATIWSVTFDDAS